MKNADTGEFAFFNDEKNDSFGNIDMQAYASETSQPKKFKNLIDDELLAEATSVQPSHS